MKKLLTVSIASILSASALSAHASNISLTDYTEASSSYEDAYVNGRLNINSGNQAQTSHEFSADINYDRVMGTPDRDIRLLVNAQAESKRDGGLGDKTTDDYSAFASASMNDYFTPGSNGMFWYSKGDIAAQKGADDPYVKLGAGLGYGRVLNVTPMAQAIRLVEALQEIGQMTGSLNVEQYNQIANIIAREDEYESKVGRRDYQAAWLADIEKVLVSAKAIQGSSLSAAGTIRARDVLVNEQLSTRRNGWLVQAGLSVVAQDFDGKSGKPAVDLGAEYHVPLSNQTQFSNIASASATIDDDDNSVLFRNTMSLTHEVSDRVDWINSWNLDYNKVDGGNDTIKNVLSSTYRYNINNLLSFDTTARLSHLDDGIKNNGNDKVDRGLFMGIHYRLK